MFREALDMFFNNRVRIFVFQQTSTLTTDVPRSDIHVAMRSLDNVCEFLKLVGSDVALIFNALLGLISHGRRTFPTFRK